MYTHVYIHIHISLSLSLIYIYIYIYIYTHTCVGLSVSFFCCFELNRCVFESTVAFSVFLCSASLGANAGFTRMSYSFSDFSWPRPACISAICSQSTRQSPSMLRTKAGSVESSSTIGSASFFFLCSRRTMTCDSMSRSSFLFGLKRAFLLLLLTHAILSPSAASPGRHAPEQHAPGRRDRALRASGAWL